jgi:adenine-specific DNA-methyltransferase
VPELNFKGKEFVYNHHLTVPFRPLVPHADKGIGEPALDGNLIIHGDNLHALKALLPMYAGKVDCIFIDPPYNTGNEGWAYNDNVNSPMIREWLNNNPIGIEDGLRHDKWACMMWPRLKLLWELLADHGIFAVSLNDMEEHRFRSIMDEIAGESAYLGTVVWKTRNTDNRVKSMISQDHEYVLIFSKGAPVRGRVIARDDFRLSENEDEPYVTDPLTGKATATERPNLHYNMVNPLTGDIYPPDPSRGWITDFAGYEALLADNRIWWPPNPATGKPRKKRFLSETAERMPASTFWGDTKTQTGADELDRIMGSRMFAFPKAVDFMARVLDLCADDESLILDSFAGSGTTAHAVLAANARDGGNRRFILVEGEDYADTLTAERVRRVINGYAFKGTQREELLREPITFTKLKNANALLEKVQQIETLDGPKFDRISKTVKDGVLIVTGERDCEETAPGLGGTFTFCTLGDPIDMDGLLTGADLPALEPLAALLYHTATAQAFEPGQLVHAPDIGGHVYRLGTANGRHLWLFYKPDLDWLKSAEAALTLSNARAIAATEQEGVHLVFAPAKFVSRDLLAAQRIPVEYAPLPYALYRVETA